MYLPKYLYIKFLGNINYRESFKKTKQQKKKFKLLNIYTYIEQLCLYTKR